MHSFIIQGPPPRELRPPLTLKWEEEKTCQSRWSRQIVLLSVTRCMLVEGLERIILTCSDEAWARQWTKLPKYPVVWFAMTSLANRLVLVGGKVPGREEQTNQLAVLESGEWTHPYPPMNIAHNSVSFNNHIIVAGGCSDKVIPPLWRCWTWHQEDGTLLSRYLTLEIPHLS